MTVEYEYRAEAYGSVVEMNSGVQDLGPLGWEPYLMVGPMDIYLVVMFRRKLDNEPRASEGTP